jgi:uncharacterized protein YcbK (DUF882 family)
MKSNSDPKRRSVLKALFSTAVAALISPVGHALAATDRQLSFYHTHTKKRLDVVFSRNGEFVESALAEINAFLADFRTGDETVMDPELFNLLFDLRESLGSSGTYEVISAYRSPKTNKALRSRSSGVARNSQHLTGKAIDVRLTGTETSQLRDVAIAAQRGGVGYYRKSDFVHIDTARVRRW